MFLSTLVLRKHFRDKSEHGPSNHMYIVIHCWHSALSSFTSTCVFRPFMPQHITIYCTKSSKTYLKYKSCNISLYNSVSPLKNPLHPGPLPDGQPISSTMVALFIVHNCTYVTEYYYHYSSALSYFVEEVIICFLLFLLILCYSYQPHITAIFIKLKYFANLHIIFHTQFVGIFTIYLHTKFNIYRHNQ